MRRRPHPVTCALCGAALWRGLDGHVYDADGVAHHCGPGTPAYDARIAAARAELEALLVAERAVDTVPETPVPAPAPADTARQSATKRDTARQHGRQVAAW